MQRLRQLWTRTKFVLTFSTILPFSLTSHLLMSLGVPGHWVLSHIMDWWVRLMFWLNGVTVVVEGLERVPAKGPYVFVANHRSLLDFSVVSYLLQDTPVYVMKRELSKIPLFGPLVTHAGTLYLERNNREKDLQTMDQLVEKLRAGYTTLIFPEGTRSSDGELQPFKKGSFHVALQAGAPIIPVSIHNSRELLPPHETDIRPGVMVVRIHEPIDVTAYTEHTLEELAQRSRDVIHRSLTLDQAPVPAPLVDPGSRPRWRHGLRILTGKLSASASRVAPARPRTKTREISH